GAVVVDVAAEDGRPVVQIADNLGRGQGRGVGADVVDRSGKVLVAPDAVAADVEDLARRDDRAGDRLAGDLLAVYVEAERAAAEGGGEVAPCVERQRQGADR